MSIEQIAAVDDGGPAFPTEVGKSDAAYQTGPHSWQAPGISKREWFAGLAMQAAATNPVGADGFNFEQRAEWAYAQADAMLKARSA